ncbi:MAG TPA: flagellar basal body P-ring protein FlgI [Steroidobacteraceae bacterium]|nr:flagellar basal body P-ring protein FlgI [Steroidobacteraceae bacterium]
MAALLSAIVGLLTANASRRRLRASCLALALALVTFLLASGPARAERVEDLATVAGVRTNQLVGYGLVVGLDGTGDQTSQTPFTIQSIENMLAKFGVTVPANTNPMLKNVAAVTVHASLPPFAKPGQTIDITVSSIGNATSLRGGSLIMTPLSGADGQVYAMAQGSVLVSGFGVEGKDGSSITVNIPSSGRIPNGATVERAVPTSFDASPYVTLNLNTPDFTTAARLTAAINKLLGPETAEALDAVSVRVRAPIEPSQRIAYVSTLERLDIDPAAPPARVIINSRTGTVVISSEVRVMAAAVASGSLTVTITERNDVSQPNAFSNGSTTVTPRSTVDVKQEKAHMFEFPAGVNLNEIVQAVNSVGAAPGDLVAILEALKEAGALRAQLIVI